MWALKGPVVDGGNDGEQVGAQDSCGEGDLDEDMREDSECDHSLVEAEGSRDGAKRRRRKGRMNRDTLQRLILYLVLGHGRDPRFALAHI